MKRGFTLLELVVVVLIIAVLATVAVTYYGKAVERVRIGEAESLMGTMLSAQERFFLRRQQYTPYWHQLDAAPVAVRTPKEHNDFANGAENTIYYTRGGVESGVLNEGFAISFEQDATDKWFVVARRVGKSDKYTYHLVRPFGSTQTVCVPVWENENDVSVCCDYMGVDNQTDLTGDPMVPKISLADDF